MQCYCSTITLLCSYYTFEKLHLLYHTDLSTFTGEAPTLGLADCVAISAFKQLCLAALPMCQNDEAIELFRPSCCWGTMAASQVQQRFSSY
jgi:hypothetical protein